MSTLTHWKRLHNPDYIGAYALNPGEDLTVTIQSVGLEMVTGDGGKKEECSVAKLIGQKPFILNKTNSKSIEKLYGPYIENWAGKSITLYASTTKLGKEMVECLRIRQAPPEQQAKPILSDKRFSDAIRAIKDNVYTLDKLRGDHTLSPSQTEKLVQEFPGQ